MSFNEFYKNHVLAYILDTFIGLTLLIAGFTGYNFVKGFKRGCDDAEARRNAIEEIQEVE